MVVELLILHLLQENLVVLQVLLLGSVGLGCCMEVLHVEEVHQAWGIHTAHTVGMVLGLHLVILLVLLHCEETLDQPLVGHLGMHLLVHTDLSKKVQSNVQTQGMVVGGTDCRVPGVGEWMLLEVLGMMEMILKVD